MHPALDTFFQHRHDELLAAMRKATGRSNDSLGLSREGGIREFFQQTLPPMARLESGDVVDSAGRGSGQLDAVLLHQGVPSLGLGGGASLMLAESVIAVVEVKSNLRTQWREVERTWSKVHPLRRAPPVVQFAGQPDASSMALPFVVIGLGGWAEASTVEQHAKELREAAGPDCPPVFVLNLDPVVYAVADVSGAKSAKLQQAAQRGGMLAHLWAYLSEATRSVAFRYIPWETYLLR